MIWKKRMNLNASCSSKSSLTKYLARQGIEQILPPQTFAFSSVIILLLCMHQRHLISSSPVFLCTSTVYAKLFFIPYTLKNPLIFFAAWELDAGTHAVGTKCSKSPNYYLFYIPYHSVPWYIYLWSRKNQEQIFKLHPSMRDEFYVPNTWTVLHRIQVLCGHIQ